MLSFVVIIIASYLIGSIPTSIILGKLLRGRDFDIRQEGSGNAGGTNVFRVLGWLPGLTVMLIDVFKGFSATVWISQWQPFGVPYIDGTVMRILAGVAAVCGHIWTVFANFRGGKGVGTAAGMLLALFPVGVLICLVIFGVVVYTTGYVSAGSMIAAASLPLVLWIAERFFGQETPATLFQFSVALALLIIFTHRKNIKRLLQGTENRFGRNRRTAT